MRALRDVLMEREKNNRALALEGWGPTIRMKLLRWPMAVGLLTGVEVLLRYY